MYVNMINRQFMFTFKNNIELLYKLNVKIEDIFNIVSSYVREFYDILNFRIDVEFYNAIELDYDFLEKLLNYIRQYTVNDVNYSLTFMEYILYYIDGYYSIEKLDIDDDISYILYKHDEGIFKINKDNFVINNKDVSEDIFVANDKNNFFKYTNGNIIIYAFRYNFPNKIMLMYLDSKNINNISISIVSPEIFLNMLLSIDKARFALNIIGFSELFNMKLIDIYKYLKLYYVDYCFNCNTINYSNITNWKGYDDSLSPTICTNCYNKEVYTLRYDLLNNSAIFIDEYDNNKAKELLTNNIILNIYEYINGG